MKRAVIYARVSTTGQGDNFSLPTQIEACRRYAQERGYAVIDEFVDTESGAMRSREGLDKVFALARVGGVEAVIVHSVDRLSRDAGYYYYYKAELRRLQVELHFATKGEITNGADDVLKDGIDILMAQMERAKFLERNRRGTKGKIEGANGAKPKLLGHGSIAPYGYKWIGKKQTRELVIDEDEAKVVKLIFEMALQGSGTLQIADRLTELGIPKPSDRGRVVPHRKKPAGEWHRGTVHKILHAHIYTGTFYHYRYSVTEDMETGIKSVKMRNKDEWFGVEVPAVISKEVFDIVQQGMADRQNLAKRNTKTFYLLARRIRCACGYAIIALSVRKQRRYRCYGSHKTAATRCNQVKYLNADIVENTIWEWLIAELTPENVRKGLEHERNRMAKSVEELNQQIALLYSQLAELDKQAQQVRTAYLARVFSLDETAVEKNRIGSARTAVEDQIRRLQSQLKDMGPSDEEMAAVIAVAQGLHDEMSYITEDEKKRWILDKLDVRVVVERIGDEPYASITYRLGGTTSPLPIISVNSPDGSSRPSAT